MSTKLTGQILGALFWILMVFLCGSTLLSISIAFNAVTAHGTCTVVFVAVAAIGTAIFASIQTMHKISWVGWSGLVFLMTASTFECLVMSFLAHHLSHHRHRCCWYSRTPECCPPEWALGPSSSGVCQPFPYRGYERRFPGHLYVPETLCSSADSLQLPTVGHRHSLASSRR